MHLEDPMMPTTPTTDLAVLMRSYGWLVSTVTDDRAVIEAPDGGGSLVVQRLHLGEAHYSATMWWPQSQDHLLARAGSMACDAVSGWFRPYGGFTLPSPVVDARVDCVHERELFYADLVIQGDPPLAWLSYWARVLGGYLGARATEVTS